tara:strand:- start:3453 stop:6119 length:2667 start_codon:yes stop_codon:yes gene_type:complete
MTGIDLGPLAEESLSTFEEIEQTAIQKLTGNVARRNDSFASGNTLTGGQAFQNLSTIQQTNQEDFNRLRREPAIARIILEDESSRQRVVYIARNSNLTLGSGREFASYLSPIGRVAELPIGEEVSLDLKGQRQLYSIIEKSIFHPQKEIGDWDSIQTQYRHIEHGTYSVESLLALLRANQLDSSDELDLLLGQEENDGGVSEGIRHQVRTAMGLRDQPILDQFQGEIFRLPLSSQLIILGPPGTGKTTTLIKRLGQKLDLNSLDEEELRLLETETSRVPHKSNWLMFTPSELLKHYLKEAFSRAQVPASDTHIRTWFSYRNDIARNTLGILRTANSGKFTLKLDLNILTQAIIEDARNWFESFRVFHEQRLIAQLKDGSAIVMAADSGSLTNKLIHKLTKGLDTRALIDIYRDLDNAEKSLKQALDDSKKITDDLLKKERNRLYNNDKDVFQRLIHFMESLQQENEPDEEEQFDNDELEVTTTSNGNKMQLAVNAYMAALRAMARSKHLKRSMPKSSRSSFIIQFLGAALPSEATLYDIGRHISFQNGLRRFINSHKRYVSHVPSSYQKFRKEKLSDSSFYTSEISNSFHLSGIELDAIILLILKNSRQLIEQSFVSKDLDEPRFGYLKVISDLFKNQIMVDEATDFSMLELACMESLTSLKSKSFFACGDFNQRITTTGIRSHQQLNWISSKMSVENIQLVYRQSRILNEFSVKLLELQGGDLNSQGLVPEDSTHTGVKPVLVENTTGEAVAKWIAERIKEVEKIVQQLPTIAVLVNSEEDVKPMAEKLTSFLEEISLNAMACEEGNALGEGTDVRVFDIQHIKGLEFEAVFFAGIDNLAEQQPELFDRYLYVGATRAATYLGLVCNESLPKVLEPLRDGFDMQWTI